MPDLAFLAYPVTGSLTVLWEVPYPASMALNPSVPVLIVTLVLSLLQCIQVAFRNVRAGRLCRDILANYRIGTDEARTAHIWPVKKVSNVGVVRCHSSDDRNSVLDGLEAIGSADTLVTPMVSFLLSVATAFAVMMVLGSLLVALLGV